MEDKEKLSPLIKPATPVKILLILWMAAVLLLHLILFTPPILLTLAEQFNLDGSLIQLQESIKPFFKTTDFSTYIKNQ